MIENSLWVERFRPSTLDGYIGNESLIKKMKQYIDNQDIGHLLFYSASPGTGKTTLSKIIANSLDSDVLYINASDENNVDTVRDKIKNFASSMGFSKWKIVILDEADFMSFSAQAALRNLQETFSKSTRFILTCVAKDTKIYVDGGYVKVQQLTDQKLITPNGYLKNKSLRISNVTKILDIKTKHGTNIKVTPNHKFIVNGNEISACDLQIGDILPTDLKVRYGNDCEITYDDTKVFNLNDIISFLKYNNIPTKELIEKILKYKNYIFNEKQFEILNCLKNIKEFTIKQLSKNYNIPISKLKKVVTQLKECKLISVKKLTQYDGFLYEITDNFLSIINNINDELKTNFGYNLPDKILYNIKHSYHLYDSIEDYIHSYDKLLALKNTDLSELRCLGRLCGFMYGDGYLDKNTIHCASNGNFILLDKIKNDIETLFYLKKYDIRKNGYENGKGICSWIKDNKISMFFSYLNCPIGNKTKQNLILPKLWHNDLFKRSFIQAIFDCESLYLKFYYKEKTLRPISFGQRICKDLYDPNIDFVHKLSEALTNYGIENYIKTEVFNDNKEKRERISRNIFICKQESILNYLLKIGNYYENYKINYDYLGYLLYKQQMTGYNFLNFNEWSELYYNDGILLDEILEITEIDGNYTVYDPCLSAVHIYNSNGIWSHNCNYVEKIIPAIRSRCQEFEIYPPNKSDVAKRLSKIITEQGIVFDIKDIVNIINTAYPDIRKAINIAQNSVIGNKLVIDQLDKVRLSYMDDLLNELKSKSDLKTKFKNIRQILADSKVRDFTGLYRFLFDHLDDFANDHIAATILIIADAQYKDSMVVDKEINIASMFVQMLNELNN